jgi:tRNA G18 (ribose-2'-O)-methylase SpoU
MFRIEKIAALDRPELAPYHTLRRAAEHEALGIFVAEGDKVVCRLLESPFRVVSVLLPEDRLPEFEPLLRARPEADIPVFAVTEKSVLEKLVGFKLFQGVLAVGIIPPRPPLEKLLAGLPRPRLLVAADGLTNAENIGLLVRNCVAFGAHALLVGETCGSPFVRRSVRNSMGTIFQLPVFETRTEPTARTGQSGSSPATAACPWCPLRGGASAHGPENPFTGGFHGRLLPGFRQRRHWNFAGRACRVRRGGGHPHAARRGFTQRRGGGGGVPL